TLLQTLCRCQKSQLLCYQANPHSSRKTPRVGHALANLSCEISDLQTLPSATVYKKVTAPYLRALGLFVSVANHILHPPLFDFPFRQRVHSLAPNVFREGRARDPQIR